MQTIVAYAGVPPEDTVSRVERHYRTLHAVPPPRRRLTSRSCGLMLWDSPVPDTLWSTWATRGTRAVASPYVAIGAGSTSTAADAPFDLVDTLCRRPERILDLTPPFVTTAVDAGTDRLDVFTDALGVGRLFEVRTAWGWVWSNRPIAALLFAGRPVTADDTGWDQSAVTDEFWGDTSPFSGVRVVGPGTRITWDGRRGARTVSHIDPMVSLLTADPDAHLDDLVEEAAADLVERTASIAHWFPGTPVVDLSGGRDSRLVAAAFLAGGTPVDLHSHDAVPGDLTTALDLVARLPGDVPHRVTHMATGSAAPRPAFAALDSARAWHAYAEGLRPCSYLHYTAPDTLDRTGSVVVGGAGGEVAHGFYYTASDDTAVRTFTEEFDTAVDVRSLARRVVQRHGPVPGATVEAREAVVEHVTRVLAGLRDAGIPGLTVLDHLYVTERMRRWGSTAERLGVCSPLLTPSFQRAALAMRPHQRRGNTVHRLITERLVPQWTGVPYYPGEVAAATPVTPRAQSPAPRVIRLADCTDTDEVEAALATIAHRGHPFDARVVADYWQASTRGDSTAAQERILRSAVWRAAFDDVCADASGEPRPARSDQALLTDTSAPSAPEPAPAAPVPPPAPTSSPDPTLTAVLLQTQAVKRLASTRLWRGMRDTSAGRGLRAAIRARR
ncbi:MAG: hypothetical protein Q4G43_06980 [Mobilicoccus sp.]|nr:hypothetical protein [Mobilicoccus sp.]